MSKMSTHNKQNNNNTNKNKKSIKNQLRSFIGFLCILLGVLLILNGFRDSIKSTVLRGSVEDEISMRVEEALESANNGANNGANKGANKGAKGNESDTIQETEWIYPTGTHTPTQDREENLNENASIGALIIPTLGKTIAIMDGVGGNNMYRGAGEQFKDAEMGVGNYVLSSHRMYDGSLFNHLEDVQIGDYMYITDYSRVYKYEVIVSDNNTETTQTELLKDTVEPILTTYGCTADLEMRVVKQSRLIGYADIEDLSEEDKAEIFARETYGGY